MMLLKLKVLKLLVLHKLLKILLHQFTAHLKMFVILTTGITKNLPRSLLGIVFTT